MSSSRENLIKRQFSIPKIVALSVFSVLFLFTAFLLVTSWSWWAIFMATVLIAASGVIPLALGLNEALEKRWPWMKSRWFVIGYRTVAVCVILGCLYMMLS